MITFALTEEQQIAQSTFRTAARDILRTGARAADEAGAMSPETLTQLWALGLVQAQEEGSRDPILNSIVLEELGWGDATLGLAVAGTMAFSAAIADLGSAKQKAEILPPVMGDSPVPAAIAVTEPSFDFDVTDMRTTAVRVGSGYRIEGVKTYVPLAASCRYLLVIANLDGVLAPFIVSADSPGIRVEPHAAMGLRALGLGRVHFNSVDIHEDMRLGEVDGGAAQRIIDCCRSGTAAMLSGLTRAVYEYVKDYTRERVAHGSALAQKQTVGFRIVDMHIAIESMRWMNWKAASELATRAPQATRSARLAHLYACEQATWITDEGIQLLGGHGFLRDHPVELWFRNSRAMTVLEGLASV